VEDYKSQFEALSNQLRGLAESYKLNCFLSGLREYIWFLVRMLNPSNLHIAFGLAKMQEKNVAALRRTAKVGSVPTHLAIGPSNPHEKRVIVPIQRLSPSQMKEQRDKGLCYNCDDKWAQGHKCKSALLFIIECDESGDDEVPTYEVVANGQAIHNEEICVAVPLHIQGNLYTIDFYILTLRGCDIVLGV